jgi:4'-phosphopantetheinyl transferase
MTYLISTEDFSEDFWRKIQKCERIVSPGIINQSSKKHSLLGRVLLSYILYKNGKDNRLTFSYGVNEKPYLKDGRAFFNISHSGSYVICSVSENEIGCDVQTVEKYNPRIATRFFTENEKLFLEKSENQSEDFTRLWTLKESVLKKTGEGITGGLASFCFADSLTQNSFIKFGYHFRVNKLIGAYISICSDAPENEITEINKAEIEKYTDSVLKGEL